MAPEVRTAHDFILQYADGWLVYLFIGLVILLGWWSWSRYGPAPRGWAGLVARICRVLALVCVVCLLTGPASRSVTTSTIPGKLAVACDISLSMGREDGPDGGDRLAIAPYLRDRLHELVARRPLELSWYTIGDGVRQVSAEAIDDIQASGPSSPLAGHMETIANDPTVDLILMLSDCRVTEGSELATVVPRLRNRNLPVWVLGTGSDAIDPLLVLDEVLGPDELAINERQPFHLRIRGRNLSDAPIEVRVLLDGEVLDERELTPPATEEPLDPVRLATDLGVVIPDAGESRLVFQVQQQGLLHQVHRTVTASERKLNVLMLAFAPRWEFRFLRDALDRDLTVTPHSYLAEGHWRRWGADGPKDIPLTENTVRDYDCLILGDVPRARFTDTMLDALVAAVREHGSGLIWLPGEYGHTAGYLPTAAGKLLPVNLPGQESITRGYLGNRELHLQRTELAERLGLVVPHQLDWADLPALRGACPIPVEDGVRKHADILMTDEELRPVVVHARYGNGASVFIAVDDTWRWRRHVGDVYLHRFWSQLIRYSSLGRGLSGKPWRLQCTPYRTIPGEIVTLSLVPTVPPDEARLPDSVSVRLKPSDGDGEPLPVQTLRRMAGDASYSVRVPAPGIGFWELDIVEGFPPDRVDDGEMEVRAPRREVNDPRIDRVAMADLTTGTGGRHAVVASREDVDGILAKLPDLSDQHKESQIRPLWANWIPLLVMVILLGLEWSLRRGHRLP